MFQIVFIGLLGCWLFHCFI